MKNTPQIINWIRRRFNTAFDNRLESFVLSLLKVDGIEEVLKDVGTAKLVWFEIKTIVDLKNLHSTVTDVYIPDAIRKAERLTKDIARSRYKPFFTSHNSNERVEEIIRQAYVTLFHTLENFRIELVVAVNERLAELQGRTVDIDKWLRETHKFKIDDLKNYPDTINRINWICNCVKHYHGYPRKKNPPAEYVGADQQKKIVLSLEQFSKDVDFVIDFTARLFKTALIAGACERFAIVFDPLPRDDQEKLWPSVIQVLTTFVVYLHTLKDESDDHFPEKLESFVKNYVSKRKKTVP